MVDDRVEPVRPDRRVDPPVAEPGGVVAAAVEPAVVEDEALDPHPRRPVGDAAQPLQVVVEPDRLPDVEHHRRVRRVGVQRALVGVPRRRQAVEPVVRGREEHPGRAVGLALREHDLAGLEQLAAADGGAAGGVALDAQDGVAAPGDVHAEDPARRRGEAGGAEHHHRGRAQPGAALAGLPEPEPVGHLVALRGAFALVPAGEVEHLGEVVTGGQHHLEPLEEVVPGGRVGEGMARPQRAAGHRLELGEELQPGLGVRGRDAQRGVRRRDVPAHEPGRPGTSRAQPVVVDLAPGGRAAGGG